MGLRTSISTMGSPFSATRALRFSGILLGSPDRVIAGLRLAGRTALFHKDTLSSAYM